MVAFQVLQLDYLLKLFFPLASRFIPKIIASLATGALTSVGDVAMKKIMGTGMISVPNDKKINLLKTNTLTKSQIKKIVLVNVNLN